MAEQQKITKRQIPAFANDKKSASGLKHRPSKQVFCLTADRSSSHTDQYLESILVDNIGTSELL